MSLYPNLTNMSEVGEVIYGPGAGLTDEMEAICGDELDILVEKMGVLSINEELVLSGMKCVIHHGMTYSTLSAVTFEEAYKCMVASLHRYGVDVLEMGLRLLLLIHGGGLDPTLDHSFGTTTRHSTACDGASSSGTPIISEEVHISVTPFRDGGVIEVAELKGSLSVTNNEVTATTLPGTHLCKYPLRHKAAKKVGRLSGSLKQVSTGNCKYGKRTMRILTTAFTLYLCSTLCHAGDPFICGLSQAHSLWKPPSMTNCSHPVQSISQVRVSVYDHTVIPPSIEAYECFDIIKEYTTWTSFFNGKGIVNVNERQIPVPLDECKSRYLLNVSASTEGDIGYSWCCKSVVSKVVIKIMKKLQIYVTEGMLTSTVGDMTSCVPQTGYCQLQTRTVIWDPLDASSSCRYKYKGNYHAIETPTHILISQLNMGLTRPDDIMNKTCAGWLYLSNEGIGYAIEEFLERKTDSTGVDKYSWVPLNSQLTYNLVLESNDFYKDLEFIYHSLCNNLNRDIRLMRERLQYEATSVMRGMLGVENIAALLTGDVVSVWPCDLVTVLEVRNDSNVDGICYLEVPVRYIHDGIKRWGFMNTISKEIKTAGTKVDCHEMPQKYFVVGDKAFTYIAGVKSITNRVVNSIPTMSFNKSLGLHHTYTTYSNDIEYNIFVSGLDAIRGLADNVIALNRMAMRVSIHDPAFNASLGLGVLMEGFGDGVTSIVHGAGSVVSTITSPFHYLAHIITLCFTALIIGLVLYISWRIGILETIGEVIRRLWSKLNKKTSFEPSAPSDSTVIEMQPLDIVTNSD